MKRTLMLMALLGSMTNLTQAADRIVSWAGVTCDPDNQTLYGAVSAYKHKSSVSYYPPAGDTLDYNMCGPASASNVLAWWMDQVEASGALIIPEGTPRGTDVWEQIRTFHRNEKPINPGHVIQYWLTGYTRLEKSDWMTEEGVNFTGQFKHLSGGRYEFNGDDRPENCLTTAISADGRNGGTYADACPTLVKMMEEGWGFALDTGNHYMTAYGVKVNESGEITEVYYSDNNDPPSTRPDFLRRATVSHSKSKNMPGEQMDATVGYTYGNTITNFIGLRTTGLTFDTYTLTMKGVAEDEALFSHFLNLVIDGADNFELQYDLRDANDAGSPVSPYLYTYKENYQVDTKTPVTTGDITLKDGTLSLVDKGGEFDGGGKTTGYIAFEAKAGATRKLSVQHTATIAEEIKVNAANGNTLEVTEGNTATFGSLTGTGTLEKTGAGTLLYDGSTSGSVTLSVKEGTLKGSGTFGSVAVDGGTLVVGNSPGQQKYLGDLTVTAGEIVFSVDGWETPADDEHVGWVSGTYSNIVMNGNALTFADGASLEFAVAGDALATMFDNSASGFTLEIATGIGNAGYFTSDLLKMLAEETIFYVANEPGATIVNDAGLSAGENLNTHITGLVYSLNDNTTLCVTGVFMRETPPVPEPATGTLGLLALAGLAARRRRK